MKFTSILALTASAMLVLVGNAMAAPTSDDVAEMKPEGSARNVALAKSGDDKSGKHDGEGAGGKGSHKGSGKHSDDDHSDKGAEKGSRGKDSGDDHFDKGSDNHRSGKGSQGKGTFRDDHGPKGGDDKSASAVVDDCDNDGSVVLGPKGAVVIKGGDSGKGSHGKGSRGKDSGDDHTGEGSGKGSGKGSGDDHSGKDSGDAK
ncbi:hypothetical protein PS15m_004121 [Mucor circinelloides]